MRSGSSVREVIAAAGDSIHYRPPEVENRSEFGHWEADTVVSPRGARGACVATFLERQTRQFFAIQMPNRTAAAMNIAIQTFVDSLPAGAVRSFSVDHGKEFATYTSVTKALQIKLSLLTPIRPGNVAASRITMGFCASFTQRKRILPPSPTSNFHQLLR
jgi:IS30 family transposase